MTATSTTIAGWSSTAARGLAQEWRVGLRAPPRRGGAKRPTAASRSAPLRKKIREIESLIAKLQKEIQAIDRRLAEPTLYEREPARATALARERADKVKAQAAAETDWLALSAEYERATAAAE